MLISQQKTMLGEPDGSTTTRVRKLQRMFDGAGFATIVSTNIDDWLLGHAAFVVPIAFALYRVDVNASRLAADPATMRLMVRGTREAFAALRSAGNTEVPRNLRILYRLPDVIVTAYWCRVLASPRGESWFAAHSRAAREEMHALAQPTTGRTRHRPPDTRPRPPTRPPGVIWVSTCMGSLSRGPCRL